MPPRYVRNYGLTHITLACRAPRQSAEFYAKVLSSHAVSHDDQFVRIQTPGAHDTIVFEASTKGMGRLGDMAHFGFRLPSPTAVDSAAAAVRATGGEVLEIGEFDDGEPYLFARDPDGYLFEIWHE